MNGPAAQLACAARLSLCCWGGTPKSSATPQPSPAQPSPALPSPAHAQTGPPLLTHANLDEVGGATCAGK